MKPTFKMLLAVLVTAATLVSGGVRIQASQPEKVGYSKPTYNISELQRNLGSVKLQVKSQPAERISFKVELDTNGEIKQLTYSHNISADRSGSVDAYIQKAYTAIMKTTFYPAKKDGQAIEDSVTINFELTN